MNTSRGWRVLISARTLFTKFRRVLYTGQEGLGAYGRSTPNLRAASRVTVGLKKKCPPGRARKPKQ